MVLSTTLLQPKVGRPLSCDSAGLIAPQLQRLCPASTTQVACSWRSGGPAHWMQMSHSQVLIKRNIRPDCREGLKGSLCILITCTQLVPSPPHFTWILWHDWICVVPWQWRGRGLIRSEDDMADCMPSELITSGWPWARC